MDERRAAEHQPDEMATGQDVPYEPPRLTVLGPFRTLTAGESSGGWADDSGKTWQ